MLRLPFLLVPILAFAACNDTSPTQPSPEDRPVADSKADPNPDGDRTPALTSADDANENTVADGVAETALPLRPGVYVMHDIDCANPPNAAFRIWNGEGLSGSATRACIAAATRMDDDDYRVENDCENTYDGSRTTETFTLAISGPDRFEKNGQGFRRCADGTAPGSLEALVRG